MDGIILAIIEAGDQATDELLNKTFAVTTENELADPVTIGEAVMTEKRILVTLNGDSWDEQLQKRKQLSSHYWHAYKGDMVIESGTWDYIEDVNQTDYDSALILEDAGYIVNSTLKEGDEISFGIWVFHPGTYKIKLCNIRRADGGKMNLYLGNAAFTTNFYNSATVNNNSKTWTFNNPTRIEGKVRLKCVTKDALSTGNKLCISRLEVIRTG